MRLEVNAKRLTKEEVQAAIDRAIISKDKSIQDILEDQRKAFLQLTELVPDFAKEMLEVIKKKYPDMLKDTEKQCSVTQSVTFEKLKS